MLKIGRITKDNFLGVYFIYWVKDLKAYSKGFNTLKEAQEFKKALQA